MSIRIFIADDHSLVRDGLRALLKEQTGFEVVGDAADGREALAKLKLRCADIVLMDIAMPGLNGIEAAREIQQVCPATRIIMLSMHSSKEYVYRALQAGARGYLLKECAGNNMVEAIQRVYGGSIYLCPKIPGEVLQEYLKQKDAQLLIDPLNGLSRREREVLQLVVEGWSSATIAATLDLSAKTVETYRSRLMTKLGVDNVPGLVKFAVRHGITPPD